MAGYEIDVDLYLKATDEVVAELQKKDTSTRESKSKLREQAQQLFNNAWTYATSEHARLSQCAKEPTKGSKLDRERLKNYVLQFFTVIGISNEVATRIVEKNILKR